jgi:putative ATP-dependent endonuclease of the OLD family
MKTLGIKNYRSFDNEGIVLENLNKINIIIGRNNCGKSNILRFLQTLHLNLNDLRKFPNDIKNQYRRNGEPTLIKIEFTGNEFPIEKERVTNYTNYDFKNFNKKTIMLNFNINTRKIELPEFLLELDQYSLAPFQKRFANGDKSTLLGQIKDDWSTKVESYIKNKFNDLIYIPHLRVIKEGHNLGDSNSTINGSNIISKMFEMQNPKIGEENSKEKFNLIQSFVKELINKEDLKIEIPHTKEEIILTIDGNRLPLDSFGTGIHQLVMLCSTLVIHEHSIVCIEEPEIHLHPELQRKFIKFLNKTNNSYFITTHSNIFLDSNLNTSIYHIQNDGIKTTAQYVNHNSITYGLLDDLGYHSSDILQANGIIWVEGPSDRIMINKWISIIDENIQEGLHYSIMFYGGRLLSNLSFEIEKTINELIPLLKLNRNAFVLMDRDGFTSKNKLNKTKSRIKGELGEKNTWVTKGREIENYLTEKTLTKWLNISKIEINENTHIHESIGKVSKIKYNNMKAKFSNEISNFIDAEDLEILDLKQRMKQLIEVIYSWNK